MKNLTILDGGMGRELKRMGAPFSQPLWSAQALIEAPQFVRQAHQNFITAGAQIITVNSYACVPFHLGEERFQNEGHKLARHAAKIAREVANQSRDSSLNVLVAGALPPALGSYRPDLFNPEQAKSIYNVLVEAQNPFVDVWLAETISSIAELEANYLALKETEKDIYYAFSLEDVEPGEARLRSGELVKEAVEKACQFQAKGIFFNCSIPEVMEGAIEDAKKIIDRNNVKIEIGVYANNFSPISTAHFANDTISSVRELSPQTYLQFAKQWHKQGATIIGGCCGISPEHIQALSDWKNSVSDL